ncbi:hypothetical protein [Pistricoccus aurantiacus]|uniref:hypothetical protein n=1 Tax=Pistricoccus aurantiacus TaxID=1883414 RepID=UPI0036289B58
MDIKERIRWDYKSWKYIISSEKRLKEYFGKNTCNLFESLRYIYVNPLEVQFKCGLSYPMNDKPLADRLVNFGRIINNEAWEGWKPVCKYRLVSCLEERFLDGVSWEESGVIDLKMKEIDRAGRSIDGCKNKNDLLKRYDRIDYLFDDMLKNGFKRQVDLGLSASLKNEMFLSIGRSGRLYFSNGGNHRLMIAQILRIEEVPFLVMARDSVWVQRVLSSFKSSDSPIKKHPDIIQKI